MSYYSPAEIADIFGCASAQKAKMEGLDVLSIEDAVQWADVIQILIPDEIQADVYEKQIKPYLRAGLR